MELTDGQRIVLAILAEPILPTAIGGEVESIPPERVAAIWSAAIQPDPVSADRTLSSRRLQPTPLGAALRRRQA